MDPLCPLDIAARPRAGHPPLTSLACSRLTLALSHQGRGDSVLVRRLWLDQACLTASFRALRFGRRVFRRRVRMRSERLSGRLARWRNWLITCWSPPKISQSMSMLIRPETVLWANRADLSKNSRAHFSRLRLKRLADWPPARCRLGTQRVSVFVRTRVSSWAMAMAT